MNLKSYLLWLLIVSLICFIIERIVHWRKEQSWMRKGLIQDVFFLFFNGHVFGLALAMMTSHIITTIDRLVILFDLPAPDQLRLLSDTSPLLQFLVFLIFKDFLEWCVHNLLHRIPFLWEFHKLHHSIVTMDWIGNFRFHFGEIVIYRTLTWLPLVILGVGWDIGLPVSVFATFIGHLNHANIKTDWGPLKYVFNSPRLHIWHHDTKCHFKNGQNFAIVFSTWDWIFGTLYYPDEKQAPDKIGLGGMEKFPESFFLRLLYPLYFWKKVF